MKFIEQRSSACLPDLGSYCSWLAAYFAFDVVECADTLDGFSSDGRPVDYLDVLELASNMSPASGFYDPAAFVEMMKARIAIRLQDAGEVGEMLSWMLTLAVFRVGEPNCGRSAQHA